MEYAYCKNTSSPLSNASSYGLFDHQHIYSHLLLLYVRHKQNHMLHKELYWFLAEGY
jgi:hypothetical protein